ncbi:MULTISPECIES: hypothetical protein [unclassified Streptomyces]|uniref:hypothetical protein n=1 Tax=unclassified Streptomyces TaxID=2593676 RepID=UPI002E80D9FC|nr:hypothetical protein [Streptomyces sp. NBC_00589]WTI37076.1 hypothetical protein OIC96_19695 [Streptomyces sp. NBC_00775]WUB29248.1 hypothetical protein OHA51_30040 [Streptomyces sp. NBC_00589]
MPDINCCQICGEAAPPIEGYCGEIIGYRLVRDPWATVPSFLDGNVHFSCLEGSDKRTEFFDEFTHLVQAGHEEVDSLDGSPPPLTRMGLGMFQIFSGAECHIFQSGIADRWMVVKKSGPWFSLNYSQFQEITKGNLPKSPSDVTRYRLPVDPGNEIAEWSLTDLLATLGVEDRYTAVADLALVDYRFVEYYAPKHLLDYVVRAPLPLPEEARAFLANHAETYVPITFDDEEGP